ncbi:MULTISPECIES: ATP-binding protein [unclassified Streptomyces]|uniref:ATP-binding protein n=1 Tax=unclassified Streptomyces TaxID=2593676 RepID=UPI002E38216F|nr:ATP-binding protein [Streptomyces sp. NBC_01439]
MIATRYSAVDVPGYSETLPCEAESASRARHLIRSALNTWGLESLIDSGLLVVSELVANSVQHRGCTLVRVSIQRRAEDRVRVTVSDKSRAVPLVGGPEAGDETGRGLVIVESLADVWAVDRRRWGKVVWAELFVEASA